ncbi:MAG: mersacidin/lichenicidin family type 2 lantibiotic [Cyclobacteriaceae bacterium]
MAKIDIIRAWKDAEYRATLSEDQLKNLPVSPVGNLDEVRAGLARETELAAPGKGWWSTISGDCNDSGSCCNPFTSIDW